MSRRVTPVILSGGAGSRLWPLSREGRPKQMLPLAGPESLIRQTAARMADSARFTRPIVVAGEAQRFAVADQLSDFDPLILLEPVARNTAPAAAVAAHAALESDPDALILLAPADHVIADPHAFLAAVERGVEAASQGFMVAFGVRPDRPATGYGYIRSGEPVAGAHGVFRIAAFVEKPGPDAARTMVADGLHAWNAGLFLLPARLFLEELARFEPAIASASEAAWRGARRDPDFVRLERAAFEACASRSIDYAVMERTGSAAVVPVDMGWSDIGSFSALREASARDAAGNAVVGDVVQIGARGSYLHSEGPLVCAVGVEDLVVVAGRDAVLVARLQSDQDVRVLVEQLKAERRSVATEPWRVERPWGWFESLSWGPGYQVKRIGVHPGRRISLQKHARRAEHWTVVEGEAEVTVGEEVRRLKPDESAFIPLGAVHRLANVGRGPLTVIEVQCGDYLGEDDIVRLEDDWKRG